MSGYKVQDFLPEEEILIDASHTLEQMSGRFQTVRDGLPELVKNSKDHYARLGVREKEDRCIVILISSDTKRLGVLDFAGAKAEDFEGWKTWSSRTANRKELSLDIEAGHGNGGKFFMVRGCTKRASMCGYNNELINRWGFINDDPHLHYRPVNFKDKKGRLLKDMMEKNAVAVLNSELEAFGISIKDLPEHAQTLFNKRKAFTLVCLDSVKDWENKNNSVLKSVIRDIFIDLPDHAQVILTVETCKVQFMWDRKCYPPLQISQLNPYPGLNETIIPIPTMLLDPTTNENIVLPIKNKENNILHIKTSERNLRLVDKLKGRNTIRIKNERNVISNWSVAELVPIPASSYVYGELRCELLTEQYITGADRCHLVDLPLVRALKNWVTKELSEVVSSISKLQSATSSEAEKEDAFAILEKLRNLMKRFLGNEDVGAGQFSGGLGKESSSGNERGTGEGGKHKTGKIGPMWGSRVDKIDLEIPNAKIKIAIGTTIPLIIRCYQKDKNGKNLPVPNTNLFLSIEDKEILIPVGKTSIKGLLPGSTKIHVETNNSKAKSNSIEIEVVEIDKLVISPPRNILKQGERTKLDITPIAKTGSFVDSMFFEANVDEINLGKISRCGFFVAGGQEGMATVRIRYGPSSNQITVAQIQIGSEKQISSGGSGGAGIPYILLCGQAAPGSDELPEGQRSHTGGSDYPTIIDWDPTWRDIIWINPTSNESKKVRARGSSLVKISAATYREFLALKCFEILKRLKVSEKFKGEAKTNTEFINALAEAEMETVEFLEEAYALVGSLVEESN